MRNSNQEINDELDKRYPNYSIPVPPVATGPWDLEAWCEYIEATGTWQRKPTNDPV